MSALIDGEDNVNDSPSRGDEPAMFESLAAGGDTDTLSEIDARTAYIVTAAFVLLAGCVSFGLVIRDITTTSPPATTVSGSVSIAVALIGAVATVIAVARSRSGPEQRVRSASRKGV